MLLLGSFCVFVSFLCLVLSVSCGSQSQCLFTYLFPQLCLYVCLIPLCSLSLCRSPYVTVPPSVPHSLSFVSHLSVLCGNVFLCQAVFVCVVFSFASPTVIKIGSSVSCFPQLCSVSLLRLCVFKSSVFRCSSLLLCHSYPSRLFSPYCFKFHVPDSCLAMSRVLYISSYLPAIKLFLR